MGCLSVIVSRPPGKGKVTAKGMNSIPEVCLMPLNGIKAKAGKMNENLEVTAREKNVKVKVSAWLVCQVNTSQIYLAVNEGWLLTINGEYISVRRT